MRYSDGCIGERRAERSGLCVNGIDVVVQIKHLSAAPQLSPDGFADKHLVVFGDVGLHRHAVLRRFLEHRHIADARQRHIQRARNGGRRQRQAVDSDRKLLEPLLVRHTEALLLVDNHQTEIFEADTFCSRRCVPTITSIFPHFRSFRISRCWPAVRKRESISTFTGKPRKRESIVW